MKIILQRVKSASVLVDGKIVGLIEKGAVALVGIHGSDTPETLEKMAQKLVQLRYFEDPQGKMNLALQEVQGKLLVISQFTLYGNCNEGRRPDFFQAAPVAVAPHPLLAVCLGTGKALEYLDKFKKKKALI